MELFTAYEIIEDIAPICQRGRSRVFHGRRTDGKDSDQQLAIKQITFVDESQIKKDELRKLAALDHVNVVKHLGFNTRTDFPKTAPRCFEIVMVYCCGGTLTHAINRDKVPPKRLLKWIKDILSGLEYLHGKNIVHRDIKSDNIFLDRPLSDLSVLKIGDFDTVKELEGSNTQSHEGGYDVGTDSFMSPEMAGDIENNHVGRKTDIWSFGCVTLNILTGKLPDFGVPLEKHMIRFHIFKKGKPVIPEVPEILRKFVAGTLERKAADRPSASTLLESELFKCDCSGLFYPHSTEQPSDKKQPTPSLDFLDVIPNPLEGHRLNVSYCKWHPTNNTHLATAGRDQHASIWSFCPGADPVCQSVLLAHGEAKLGKKGDSEITCMEWSPSGDFICLGTKSGMISFWRKNGEMVKTMTMRDESKGIKAVKWNRLGTLLLSSDSGLVQLWKLDGYQKLHQYEFNGDEILDVDWQYQNVFSVGGMRGNIYFCDNRVGSPIQTLEGSAPVTLGTHLATCSRPKTIRIWTQWRSTWKNAILGKHSRVVYSMRWINNELLLVGSRDETIGIWNVAKSERVHGLVTVGTCDYTIGCTNDGRFLAAAGGKMIFVWSIDSGVLLQKIETDFEVLDVDWNRSGSKLAVGGGSGKVWVFTTSSALRTL